MKPLLHVAFLLAPMPIPFKTACVYDQEWFPLKILDKSSVMHVLIVFALVMGRGDAA